MHTHIYSAAAIPRPIFFSSQSLCPSLLLLALTGLLSFVAHRVGAVTLVVWVNADSILRSLHEPGLARLRSHQLTESCTLAAEMSNRTTIGKSTPGTNKCMAKNVCL